MTRLRVPSKVVGRRGGVLLGFATLVLALAASGCGGAIPSSDGGPARVSVSHGHLVDAAGRSLYLFQKDAGNESYCTGACAAVWPALDTSSKPVGGSGVATAALGMTDRPDGDQQVTYHGHPLYYYAADASRAGSTKGQAIKQFGDEWYLLAASGQPVETTNSGGSNGGGNSGGGGY